jgi:hypothetical protein
MPQDVELGGLREHPNDPAAVYEITLRGTPPAGLTARFPSMTLHSIVRWSGPKGQHRPLAPRARSSSGSTVWIWRKFSSRSGGTVAATRISYVDFPICASIRGSVNAARMPDIRMGDFTRSG